MNLPPCVGLSRRCRAAIAMASFGVLSAVLAQISSAATGVELHRALSQGQPHWRALLEAGADASARDSRGDTPLHLAALRSNAEAVEALLARKADPNATNHDEATPLHYGTGDERIVHALLARGGKPNAMSKSGMTPLLSAVQRGNSYAVARLLVEAGADLEVARGGDKNALLTQAIFGGDFRTVRFLLERGARPMPVASRDGSSSLEIAALQGDVDLVRMLLARGADVNTPSNFFGHALNAAFYSHNPHIAAFLVERGADLQMRSPFGHGVPPMVWSAYNEHGDTTVARLLASHGADLDAANDSGDTALTWALKRGADTPLVKHLRSAGAKEPSVAARLKAIPAHDVPPPGPARAALIRERTQRSVDLLARSSRAFLENKFVRDVAKCSSCHHQMLAAVTFDLARQRGLTVDDVELGRLLDRQLAMWSPKLEAARQMRDPIPDPPVSMGYGFDALAALRYPADELTDAYIHYLIGSQLQDGSWVSFDIRPPMEAGKLVATAWSIRAIQLYPPPGEAVAAKTAVERAREWLRYQEPATPEEQTFQLLGLAWSDATPAETRPFAQRVISAQRADGGWSSLRTRESDAWATGTALLALHKTGMPTTDAIYQRGVAYLLRTQFVDGSWWVRSRTWPFQPHFDSQFPHGKDQWISAGGTAWAAIALLLTLTPESPPPEAPATAALLAKFAAATGASAAAVTPSSAPATYSATPSPVNFARQIQPVLERSCASCHSGEKLKGDFSIATRDALLKGGQSGDPAIVPGRSGESRLLAYVADQVEDLEMPPLNRREKYPALSADEIALLRSWIDHGARWD